MRFSSVGFKRDVSPAFATDKDANAQVNASKTGSFITINPLKLNSFLLIIQLSDIVAWK
jgi:hypothetical protein